MNMDDDAGLHSAVDSHAETLDEVDQSIDDITEQHITQSLHNLFDWLQLKGLTGCNQQPMDADITDLAGHAEALEIRLRAMRGHLRAAQRHRDDLQLRLSQLALTQRHMHSAEADKDLFLQTALVLGDEIVQDAHADAVHIIADARAQAEMILAQARVWASRVPPACPRYGGPLQH